MTDIRTRIANAHLNLPPLKRPSFTGPKDEIVLFEGTSNSIVDKLNQHRKNEPTLDKSHEENEAFKWIRMKEKMMLDMEDKRDVEWQQKTLNDKLENEEFEEILDDNYGSDDDDNEDVRSETKAESNDNHSDAGEEADGEEDEDDEKNHFIEDQAIEEDINEYDSEQGDEQEDELFTPARPLRKIIDDDEDEDERNDYEVNSVPKVDDENDEISSGAFGTNEMNFPFPPLNHQDSDQYCTSQNVPLIPFDSGSRGSYSSNLESLGFTDNNYGDSQMLANLCSGQFGSGALAVPEDDEVASGSEADENDNDIEESGDDAEEGEMPLKVPVKKHRISEFIEDEAELSGSEDEVSSDENEDEGEDELEEDEIQEDLPSDDEIRGQLGKMYNKELLDEDKRQLMIMKEYFFEDGDLHDEDDERKKKFKWNLNGEEMDDFNDVLSDSEDDNDNASNASDDDAEDAKKVIRLKLESTTPTPLTTTIEPVISGDSQEDVSQQSTSSASETISGIAPPSRPSSATKSKQQIIRSNKLFKKKVNTKISSFFIKDERLRDILNKRPAAENNFTSVNKKQKTEESKSIFDCL